MSSLAHGDLGSSYVNHVSSATLIGQRIGLTAARSGRATLFAVLITVPLATVAAARKDGLADHFVRALSVTGLGMPAFWFGIVLIEIFALRLHVVPVGGGEASFGAASSRRSSCPA